MIRVGRRVYNKDGSFTDPSYPGFTNIFCLTKSSEYGSVGPYELKDENGWIMENIYQAHKIYKKVPKSVQRYSRYDQTIIWDHGAEQHMDEKSNAILPAYWIWREKLMKNKYPVRYPVGFNYRDQCVGSIYLKDSNDKTNYQTLNYIDARKQIYMPVFIKLARNHHQFKELLDRLKKGENLLIIEVDGPHQESINYYIEKYSDKYVIGNDFIINNTILATADNMKIMLNDSKHPFGHGYCLAIGLLDLNVGDNLNSVDELVNQIIKINDEVNMELNAVDNKVNKIKKINDDNKKDNLNIGKKIKVKITKLP